MEKAKTNQQKTNLNLKLKLYRRSHCGLFIYIVAVRNVLYFIDMWPLSGELRFPEVNYKFQLLPVVFYK